MNYNPFDIEARILINKLNDNGYEPVNVNFWAGDSGDMKLKEKNEKSFLGHNARIEEALDHIMSVDESEVIFTNKKSGHTFSTLLVRGNSPGELVNDIFFNITASEELKEAFNDLVKEAAAEFEIWTDLNDKYLDETGIAYALGMTLEEAAEAY